MTAALASALTAAERLTDFLREECRGRDRALHLPEIASCLDLLERDVQTAAREAREGGAPICSSSCGLWYAPDDHRAMAYRQMRRGLSILTNGRTMLKSSAPPGQDPLFDCPPEILVALAELREEA